jgi:hypothetical protein
MHGNRRLISYSLFALAVVLFAAVWPAGQPVVDRRPLGLVCLLAGIFFLPRRGK